MKEALKLALEALERVNTVDDDCDILARELADAVVDAIDAIKEALAQPEQGPVAWGMRSENGQIYDVICPEEHADCAGAYTVPLYTTPPKRQPLTDKQAHQALLDMSKHIETFGDESTTEEQLSGECIRFILEQVAAHGIKE